MGTGWEATPLPSEEAGRASQGEEEPLSPDRGSYVKAWVQAGLYDGFVPLTQRV